MNRQEFGIMLKDAMKRTRINSMDLANYLGCDVHTVRNWKDAKALPRPEMYEKLKDLFSFKEECPKLEKKDSCSLPFFNGEKFKNLMKETDLSIKEVSELTGIGLGCLYNYTNSLIPSRSNLDRLNEAFSTVDEYWCSIDSEEEPIQETLPETDDETFEAAIRDLENRLDALNHILNDYMLRVKDVEAQFEAFEEFKHNFYTYAEKTQKEIDNLENAVQDTKTIKQNINLDSDLVANALASVVLYSRGGNCQ